MAYGDHQEFVRVLWAAAYGLSSCMESCESFGAGKVFGTTQCQWLAFLESVGDCWPRCFQVPSSFKYKKSTSENYKAQEREGSYMCNLAPGDFVGDYVELRALRNLSYHNHYTVERQFWQDAWIRRVVQRVPGNHKKPWLIYTAGGMGVGKGWVMEWLTDKGFLGIENIVYVNPDYFKSVMPEYEVYKLKQKTTEGTMCHKESGYMQELALWAALKRGCHVLEDGSLRDTEWYAGRDDSLGIIPFIKEKFRSYRVAIIYIDLFLEVALKKEEVSRRLEKRGNEVGGRSTPFELAWKSYKGSEDTVNALVEQRLADFVVHIDNTGRTPKLVRIATKEGWQESPRAGHPDSDWELMVGKRIGPEALRADRGPITQEEQDGWLNYYSQKLRHSWDELVPTLVDSARA